MTAPPSPLNPPRRVLMGPGPSDVAPSVLQALARPTVGHLDPYFLTVMDEVRAMLRTVFDTEAELCFPMSGTGSAGMETCFANLLEPGDRVLIGVHGVFGTRMVDVCERLGAEVETVEAEWGRALDPEAFRARAGGRPFKLVALVHAETSTGVSQDLTPFRALCDELGALLVVDMVTSLGGTPVHFDRWGVDAAYSGTQKCLSCPPGLAPIAFSERAAQTLASRGGKVPSWYLDLSMIANYWGAERAYHHTAPINMLYGLHEALRLVLEEGLAARWERHDRLGRALVRGLEALGLEPLVEESVRLPQLTSVRIPDGIDDGAVRGQLLRDHALEIGGGLGPLKGKVWRIGLMGAAATEDNVRQVLSALAAALAAQGWRAADDPLAAAALEAS